MNKNRDEYIKIAIINNDVDILYALSDVIDKINDNKEILQYACLHFIDNRILDCLIDKFNLNIHESYSLDSNIFMHLLEPKYYNVCMYLIKKELNINIKIYGIPNFNYDTLLIASIKHKNIFLTKSLIYNEKCDINYVVNGENLGYTKKHTALTTLLNMHDNEHNNMWELIELIVKNEKFDKEINIFVLNLYMSEMTQFGQDYVVKFIENILNLIENKNINILKLNKYYEENNIDIKLFTNKKLLQLLNIT